MNNCSQPQAHPDRCGCDTGERSGQVGGPKRVTALSFDLSEALPGAASTEHYELPRPATPANYLSLQAVLDEAFNQAAYGKGAQRHAQSKPFEEQPMQKLIELYGIGFGLGQAGKKMQEAQRMEVEPAVRELLGAINYIAGTIIHLEKNNGR